MSHDFKIVLLTVTTIVLCAGAFLRVGAGQAIKISLETESMIETAQYTSLVEDLVAGEVAGLPGYQLVPKAESKYLIKAGLTLAREVIVDGVPTAEIGFVLRIFDMDAKAGAYPDEDLINKDVTKRFVGVQLESAIREMVTETTAETLAQLSGRISAPGSKKLPAAPVAGMHGVSM